MGLANKLTSKYCKKVLTSFTDTAKLLKNAEFVGPPIRKTLFETNKNSALKFFNFDGNKPILLVMGGSQGAKAINDTLRNSLNDILPKYDIIHICGKGNLSKQHTQNNFLQETTIERLEGTKHFHPTTQLQFQMELLHEVQ